MTLDFRLIRNFLIEPTLLLWLKAGVIPCFLNSLQSKDFEENNTALLAVNNIVSISPACKSNRKLI